MAETVRRDEIILRRRGCHLVDDLLQRRVVRKREKHRLDVGIVHLHMTHTVILLVPAGKLMLLDYPVYIVVDIGGHHNSILRAPIHRLGIDIVMFPFVSLQPAFLPERGEILDSLGIHLLAMLIGACGEINLRLYDMI